MPTKKQILIALMGVVKQNCEINGKVNNMWVEVYIDACEILEKYGLLVDDKLQWDKVEGL